ncbi:hypothetical protein [Saccharothrix deserti]|uniref:hypothetical protein n=1 Tax=Saccharothrix deserti TaxID=2593674 RepID=UPI00131BB6BE|nr:hypothetical protein [Saccharothrix deserti]
MIKPTDHRTAIVGGVVVLAALGAYLALGATLAPATPSVDARAIAGAALSTAQAAQADQTDQTDGIVIADEVGRVLPEGTRAVVVRPGRANEVPSREGTHRVAVVVGEVDRAAVSLLVAEGGVVGSSATPDGWWAAVSVPASVSAPVVPALALLVAAVLLGAAAAEVSRTRSPPVRRNERHERHERHDVLVRGLTDLLPRLPEDVACQAYDVLAAGGVRVVVPDGHPLDARHHVVGTEVTDDPELVDTVARTVRPGYADGHRVVVRPEVVAYVGRTAR